MSSAAAASASPDQENLSQLQTLAAVCLEAVTRHQKPNTVSEKRSGKWVHISAEEFTRRVRHIALGIVAGGIRPQDRIALISENRPEWSIVDLAILSAGAVTVPLYTTQSIDQIEFILRDSGTRALMISGGKILRHARKGFERVENLEQVVVFDSDSARGLENATTLEAVEARGAEIETAHP